MKLSFLTLIGIVGGLAQAEDSDKNSPCVLGGDEQPKQLWYPPTDKNLICTSGTGRPNNVENSEDSVVIGQGNQVENGSKNGVFGVDNKITGADKWEPMANKNYIIGDSNGGIVPIAGDYNFIMGYKNGKVTGNGNNVYGSENAIGGVLGEIGSGNNNVTGNHNHLQGEGNTIAGNSNRIDGSSNNIMGSYNDEVEGEDNTVSGNGNAVNGDENIVAGNDNIGIEGGHNILNGNGNDVVMGDDNSVTGNINKLIIGNRNNITGSRSRQVEGDDNTVSGNKNAVVGNKNIAMGGDNSVIGNKNITIGNNNDVVSTYLSGKGNSTMGNGNFVRGNGHITSGFHNIVTGYNNIALGNYITIGGTGTDGVSNSVAIGFGSKITSSDFLVNDRGRGVVSIGGQGMERRLINVADGVNNNDAVNFGQVTDMFEQMNTKIESEFLRKDGTNFADTSIDRDAIGKSLGVASLPDNTTPPSEVAQGDGGSVPVSRRRRSAPAEATSPVQPSEQNVNARLVQVGAVMKETRVSRDGAYIRAGKPVARNLTALDTQVKINADAIKMNVRAIDSLDRKFIKTTRILKAGIAGVNASVALPQGPIGKSSLGVAVGQYQGQSALALGYSTTSDDGKILVRTHVNLNTQKDLGAGAGVAYSW